MATHRYRVGATVYLQAGEGNLLPGARPYLVEAQMPPLGTSLQYRVKSETEAFRRIVPEYLMSSLAEATRTVPRGGPHAGEED